MTGTTPRPRRRPRREHRRTPRRARARRPLRRGAGRRPRPARPRGRAAPRHPAGAPPARAPRPRPRRARGALPRAHGRAGRRRGTGGDMLADTRLCFGGHRFRQGTSGLTALCVSRPTLESDDPPPGRGLGPGPAARGARRGRPRRGARRSPGRGRQSDRPRRRERRGAARRPTWSSTPPVAARGCRAGWSRWATRHRSRSGSPSASATPAATTAWPPARWAATSSLVSAPTPDSPAAGACPSSRAAAAWSP